MRVAVDLHIHTALSPCADNEMTPNNIVNMAFLKGLNVIAITDHNSVLNFEAVSKCAQRVGILAIPGMEIETCEEVHLICLFPTLADAMNVQDIVFNSLPNLNNREDIFGQQLVLDDNDNITATIERMLITATYLSVEEIFSIINDIGGVVIPAHIDRNSYSIISNLGIIPEDLSVKFLEISKDCNKFEFRQQNPQYDKYKLITSSDAHYLGNILEKCSFLEIEEISIDNVIKALKP